VAHCTGGQAIESTPFGVAVEDEFSDLSAEAQDVGPRWMQGVGGDAMVNKKKRPRLGLRKQQGVYYFKGIAWEDIYQTYFSIYEN